MFTQKVRGLFSPSPPFILYSSEMRTISKELKNKLREAMRQDQVTEVAIADTERLYENAPLYVNGELVENNLKARSLKELQTRHTHGSFGYATDFLIAFKKVLSHYLLSNNSTDLDTYQKLLTIYANVANQHFLGETLVQLTPFFFLVPIDLRVEKVCIDQKEEKTGITLQLLQPLSMRFVTDSTARPDIISTTSITVFYDNQTKTYGYDYQDKASFQSQAALKEYEKLNPIEKIPGCTDIVTASVKKFFSSHQPNLEESDMPLQPSFNDQYFSSISSSTEDMSLLNSDIVKPISTNRSSIFSNYSYSSSPSYSDMSSFDSSLMELNYGTVS